MEKLKSRRSAFVLAEVLKKKKELFQNKVIKKELNNCLNEECDIIIDFLKSTYHANLYHNEFIRQLRKTKQEQVNANLVNALKGLNIIISRDDIKSDIIKAIETRIRKERVKNLINLVFDTTFAKNATSNIVIKYFKNTILEPFISKKFDTENIEMEPEYKFADKFDSTDEDDWWDTFLNEMKIIEILEESKEAKGILKTIYILKTNENKRESFLELIKIFRSNR